MFKGLLGLCTVPVCKHFVPQQQHQAFSMGFIKRRLQPKDLLADQGLLSSTVAMTYTPEMDDVITVNATTVGGCEFEIGSIS